MQKTFVSKDQLVSKLKDNRDNHRQVYDAAIEGYRTAAIGRLNTMVDELKAGKLPQLYVRLPIPEDHTDEYDALISMLEMSTEDSVEIDLADYRAYVLDDWGWKKEFISTASNYTIVR